MKLRSYLRGIGIGIIVTSAIFIVGGAGKKQQTMTDAQVIARAKELGMIESTVLSEMNEEAVEPTAEIVASAQDEIKDEALAKENEEVTKEAEPTAEAEPTEEVTPEPTQEPTPEVTPEPTPEPTPEVTPEPTPEKPAKDTPSGNDENTIVVVVNAGDGSDTVAKRVFEAGLVSNASEFDKYLMANGYDRKITIGNHKIAASATEEEIAKNLVSSTK